MQLDRPTCRASENECVCYSIYLYRRLGGVSNQGGGIYLHLGAKRFFKELSNSIMFRSLHATSTQKRHYTPSFQFSRNAQTGHEQPHAHSPNNRLQSDCSSLPSTNLSSSIEAHSPTTLESLAQLRVQPLRAPKMVVLCRDGSQYVQGGEAT